MGGMDGFRELLLYRLRGGCGNHLDGVKVAWECFMGVCHATVLDVGDGGVESSRILEYGCRAW